MCGAGMGERTWWIIASTAKSRGRIHINAHICIEGFFGGIGEIGKHTLLQLYSLIGFQPDK
jgi:hypothetical protein